MENYNMRIVIMLMAVWLFATCMNRIQATTATNPYYVMQTETIPELDIESYGGNLRHIFENVVFDSLCDSLAVEGKHNFQVYIGDDYVIIRVTEEDGIIRVSDNELYPERKPVLWGYVEIHGFCFIIYRDRLSRDLPTRSFENKRNFRIERKYIISADDREFTQWNYTKFGKRDYVLKTYTKDYRKRRLLASGIDKSIDSSLISGQVISAIINSLNIAEVNPVDATLIVNRTYNRYYNQMMLSAYLVRTDVGKKLLSDNEATIINDFAVVLSEVENAHIGFNRIILSNGYKAAGDICWHYFIDDSTATLITFYNNCPFYPYLHIITKIRLSKLRPYIESQIASNKSFNLNFINLFNPKLVE